MRNSRLPFFIDAHLLFCGFEGSIIYNIKNSGVMPKWYGRFFCCHFSKSTALQSATKGIIPYSTHQENKLTLQNTTCLEYLQSQQKNLNNDSANMMLDIVDMGNYGCSLVSELSLGQRRCLSVAATMIVPSKYYLFHNLFEGLTDKNIAVICKALEEISTYATFFLSYSSDVNMSICDRIIYLHRK